MNARVAALEPLVLKALRRHPSRHTRGEEASRAPGLSEPH
jgi:hypothetical protein